MLAGYLLKTYRKNLRMAGVCGKTAGLVDNS